MGEITLNVVQQINSEYALAQENFTKAKEYGSQALLHARNCGEKLLEAKAQCVHGEWLTWLADNTQIPARTAQRFMKIALNWDLIQAELESTDTRYFGINEAQKLLSASEEKSKNATMAYLTENDFKAFKLDSLERTAKLKQEAKRILEQVLSNFESVEKFYNLHDNLESPDLTDEVKYELLTLDVKAHMNNQGRAEEEMRRDLIDAYLEFGLNPEFFDKWVLSESGYNPKMIHQFISTDKSLLFDLWFDFYSEEETVDLIEKSIVKASR